MKLIDNPSKQQWANLCSRPVAERQDLGGSVGKILNQVKSGGDAALMELTAKFDSVAIDSLLVPDSEREAAAGLVPENLKEAINLAIENVKKFHASQNIAEEAVFTSEGVKCWRRSVPIEKVGLYIPGGTAPLFSTVIMLAVPAIIAGCQEIVMTSPPDKSGKINPVTLYTADLLGITKIFKVGGAQAVAAMAYGTESIPGVYKIFGPGNQYVTMAKEMVQLEGIAIDMPAGPSEVLVIADETSKPVFVVADLLSQAEHGVDSQVILVGSSRDVVEQCLAEVNNQVKDLPRRETAEAALQNSTAIVFDNSDDCLEFSNMYAPEHLIIATDNALSYVDKITNAGSVFLGHLSCESAGDYASGTNHTLPTNGNARVYSGVSLDSYVKKITFQELSDAGIRKIGPAIEVMAEAEGLEAHKNAVSVRLNALNNV